MNLGSLPHSDRIDAPPNDDQLSLPSGPGALLRGGRSSRTDEDRDFLASAFKVRAGGVSATAIYRCLAYYASLTDRRIAYPSQATIASYCDMSVRQVRRILPKLEADGWIVCIARKRGACSSTYELSTRMGQDGLLEWDMMSYEEGKARSRSKSLSLVACEAQSKGIPAPTDTAKDPDTATSFPSPAPDQEQDRARAPVAKETEPVFDHPGQVAKLFKLQRKLHYSANDEQAKVFDGLEHGDKARILNRLEAEEQQAAIRGEVSAPPPKTLAPRHLPPFDRPTPPRERTTCSGGEHRWTPPTEDGIASCVLCGEERGQLRAVDDDNTHFTSSPLKKPGQKHCRHVWAAADSEGISVCAVCGAEAQ